jgi:hypothetical protein
LTDNPLLADLGALSGLASLTGILVVEGNPSLESLAGLDNLASVGRRVEISGNSSLRSLSGLGVETVGDGAAGSGILVTGNAGLAALDLTALVTVSGTLGVWVDLSPSGPDRRASTRTATPSSPIWPTRPSPGRDSTPS